MSYFSFVSTIARRLQRPALATLLVAGALVVGTVTAPPEVAFAAPVCASPPLSGSTAVSGIVNGYFAGQTSSVAAGQANTTVTVAGVAGATTPLAVGDLVLIIQMQGAQINSTNTNAYGDGVAGGEGQGNTSTNFLAGRYEYARVASVSGSTIGLTGSGTNDGLNYSYQNSAATAASGQYRYQVIRVPQYSTAVLDPATPPTALAWNGSVGGIVVLDAANTLDLNGATIDVTGLGFRPGLQRVRAGTSTGGFANTDYRTPTSAPINGQKAEGIAGTPVWQTGDPDSVGDGYPNGDFGRGAPGNAGGGGTDGNQTDNGQNSGGGGGGNGGLGGRGGNTWSSNLPRGGNGGATVTGGADRLVMGGGGGAGSDNNAVLSSKGGAGGGIVLIRSGDIAGTGTITANGVAGDVSGQDGSGGGGAGGTVAVVTSATGGASGLSGLTINARGGAGGNETNAAQHGPGGGGGGGRVITSAAPATATVTAGVAGIHVPSSSVFGAFPGTIGAASTTSISAIPGANTGSQCIDLSITKDVSPANVVPGETVTYTVVATNNGPFPVTGTAPVTVADVVPAALTGVTWTCSATAGSNCAATGSGSLATTANLALGGIATYTITGILSPSFTGTLSNTATVSPPSGVPELDPSDNSDTADSVATPRADLSITKTDFESEATPGTTVTYTVVVTNAGPSSVTAAPVTDALPAGTTGGTWSCSSGVGATCGAAGDPMPMSTDVSLDPGATATYLVNVDVSPTATGSLVNTASIDVPGGVIEVDGSDNMATDSDTLTPTGDLSVSKTDGVTSVDAGTATTYTIVAANTGPSTVTGATVTDMIPPQFSGATWTCTASVGSSCAATGSGDISESVTLASSGTATFTVVATVDPTATGTISNTAAIAGPGTFIDPTPTNNSATDTTTITRRADLQITKTDNSLTEVPGTSVTYTIVASNPTGPSAVTGATVLDTLPAALSGANWTCVASAGSSCAASGSGNINTAVDLLVNGTATFTLTANIDSTATGNLDNTASITAPADVVDPTTGNNSETDSDTLLPTADLSITIDDGSLNEIPGTDVTYTVVATNAGPSAVTGTTIAVPPPATLTGLTWTCVAAGGAVCPNTTGSGPISEVADLPSGATLTYIVTGDIAVDATGNLTVPASITTPVGVTDPTPADNDNTDVDQLTPTGDLRITKTDSQDDAVPGEAISYTIVVSNPVGPSDMLAAAVADTIPSDINGAMWTCAATGGGACGVAGGSGDINTTVDLPVGASATYTVTGTVDAAATGTLTNTATITAGTGTSDSDGSNNSATDIDGLTPEVDLVIVKDDGETDAVPGTSVEYTITVTNPTGPSDVTGAIVTDTFPAELSGTGWTCIGTDGGACTVGAGLGDINTTVDLPVGATATFTATGTVSSAATGSLTNAASVSAPTGVTETDGSDNTDSDIDTLTPDADLSVTKTDGQDDAVPGAPIVYTMVVSNGGPSTIVDARFTDTLSTDLLGATWTCGAAGDSSCPAPTSGSGSIDELITVAPGDDVTFTLSATVAATATGTLVNSADIALPSGATDPTPTNNTVTDTDTLTPQADLEVTKVNAGTTVVAGTSTGYTIEVTNNGPSIVTGATVADVMPSGLSGVTWTCTATSGSTCPGTGSDDINASVDLAVDGVATFVVAATVLPGATGNVVNTATAAVPATVADPTPGNNSATDTDSIEVVHDLVITKDDGATVEVPGTAIQYTIVVANPTGPSDAVNAAVVDALPATLTGATWTCLGEDGGNCDDLSGSGDINTTVDLPVGGTATFTVVATITATATGSLVNTATVTPAAGSTDPTPADNTATDTDTLDPQADLQITKTDGQDDAVPGEAIEYTIVVTNTGPSVANGAAVTDTLPAGLTAATWTCTPAGGGSCAAGTGSDDINTTVDLPVGATATFVVSATVERDAAITVGPTLTNTAAVAPPTGVADPSGPNSATDTDDLTPEVDLVITKDDGVTVATPGGSVTYTITASNPTGPSDVEGATVVDTFPAAITAAAWTCVATGGASCAGSGSGDINEAVDLPVGGVATFTVDVDIDAAATGVLSNDATISVPAGVTEIDASDNMANDSDTLTPNVDLSISKTDGQTTAVPGDPVTYTIVVTNGGVSDVTGATVTDAVPASLSFVTWTCSATSGSSCTAAGSGSISDTVDVDAGGTLTYMLSGTLSPSAAGTLDNTVSVALPGPLVDPTPGNNTSTDSDTITPVADLEITKDDGVTSAAPGTTVTYTVVAANNGPSDVLGATVTDTVPAGVTTFTWTCGSSSGATCANATGSGAISELVDLPAGSAAIFTITATISPTATGTLDNTATVAVPSGTTDPGPGPNSATDSDVLGPIADLSVTKDDGTDTATPGGTTVYTIVVSNAGPSPALDTVVTDVIPAGASALAWTCAPSVGAACDSTSGSGAINTTVDLPPSTTATFLATVTIDPAATGTLDNTVDVTPGPGVNDPDDPADRTATDSDTLAPVADLSITKTDGVGISIPGQSTTYTLVVRNDGPSVVTNAPVTDTLPAALASVTWTCSATTGSNCDDGSGTDDISTTVDLAVNGEATFLLTAAIDPTALGTLSNTAGVTPPTGTTDPDSDDQTATDTNTLVPTADLSITKTDGRTSAAPLDATTYTIVVSNSGDSAVSNAPVADTLPAELTGANWTCTNGVGGNCDDASGAGNVATTVDLAPGGSVTIEVTGTLAASAVGTVSNTASVSVPAGVVDPSPVNEATDDTSITPTADLSISKTDGQTEAVPGESLTYTIVVSNAGPSAVADMAVDDAMPAELNGVSWTCAAVAGSNCDDASGSGGIASTVDLASGGSVTFSVTATLDASATGVLSNTAALTPPVGLVDATTGDHSATDVDTITPEADLTISKTHGGTDSAPGESISYTIVVGNDGPSDVVDAVVDDSMPAELSSVTWACVAAGGATCADAGGSGDIATTVDVPVGGTATFTVTGTIDPDATGTLTNTATVSVPSGVTETDVSDNVASDTNPLTPSADLSITKTDGAMSSVAGTAISYTIVASNPGPSTIVGATVTDTPPATLTNVSWSCVASLGSSCGVAAGIGPIADTVTIAVGGSVTYTLNATVAASASGSVTNTAGVALPVGSTDPTPGNNTADDTNTITGEADLAITKDDSSLTAVPGGTTTYDIVVTNPTGPSDVVGATVTDALPVGATSMNWTCTATGGGACAASGTGALSESVDVPIGGSVTFSVTVAIDPSATGTITNSASVETPVGVIDPVSGNDTDDDTDTLEPAADIAVTNTDGVTSTTPGTTTTYTVTVSNDGPSDAPGTAVSFPVPAGGTITGWACADDGTSTCTDASGSGAVTTSADLAAGTSVTYTITVDIDQTATGTLDTTATATTAPGITDPTPANNTATDIDTLTLQSDLSITKTDGVGTSVPGGPVSYTIVVSNDGPSAVTAAPVTDNLPATLTAATWVCSATAGSACADPSGTDDISTTVDLLDGGSATFTLDATVDSAATGTLTNAATVDVPAGITDPDDADRTATDTNSLVPEADLSITKTDGATAVAPLQATTYTIVVTNDGPSDVVDAAVTDTIPAQLTGATWTCADGAGGTCDTVSGTGDIAATVDLAASGTVTFSIDASVIGAASGTITNTATVTTPAGTTDPDASDNDASDTSIVAPVADLSITKTDGVTSASSGTSITYSIVVSNAGPSDVVDARVEDSIPGTLSGATWTCVADAGADCDATSGTGSIDELVGLDSGTTVTYTVTATVAAVNGTITNTATVDTPAGTTDPDTSNDSATDTTTVDPIGNLSITKTDGRTEVTPGTSTSYTIVVTNEGPSDVTGVAIDDAVPSELTAATWTCSPSLGATCTDATGSGDIATTVDLDAGATATFILDATIAADAAGTVSNTASLTPPSNYTDSDTSDDTATDDSEAAPIADLAITKTNGSTETIPGTSVSYTIVVTNSGPSSAIDALVTDALPTELTGATWTCVATAGASCSAGAGTGSLDELVTVGPAATVTFTVVADVDAGATGQLTNTATVDAPTGTTDPDPDNNDDTDTDDLTPTVDLAITKTDGATSVTPGTPTTYAVVVTNVGPSDVLGATVTDVLPAELTGVTWTCASSLGSSCPGSGTGDIDVLVDLPAGGTVTFTIDATVVAGATGILTNTATVAAPSGVTDTDPSNDSATDDSTLSPTADLVITKTDGAVTSVPGTAISYTITATNSGPSDVTGGEIADRLPAELLDGTWSCTAATGAGCGEASGAGNVNVDVDVPVGGAVTVIVTADIAPGATGLLVNSATISTPTGVTDANPLDNSATDTNDLDPTADLSITKTDALTGALPGETITYTIVVGNAGPSSVLGAPVADTIPPELENVSWVCSATAGSACGDAAGSGDIASTVDLAVGGGATYTVTADVVASVTGTVANSATVATPPGVTDPDPSNNADSDSTTISPLADVSITKTDGVTTIAAGVSTTYSIVVTNPGPSALTGVRIVDTLPTSLVAATWTCATTGGATCAPNGAGDIDESLDMPAASTATFTVTATVDAAASGTITNTALVELPAGTVDPTPSNNSATDDTIVEGVADLAITKTDGAATSVPGTPITYDLVITNAGPSDAVAATVADTMPVNLANAAWTCAPTAGAACTTPSGFGDVNAVIDVPVGGIVTITVTADIATTATGQLSNTAVVSPSLGTIDPNLGDNTATDVNALTPRVDLGITIDDGVTEIVPGGTTTYTITVTNTGPSAASGAPVSATFPPELTGVTWTSDGPTPSGTGDIDDVVDLPVGGIVTYTVVVTAAPDARGSVTVPVAVSAPVGVTEVDPSDNVDDDIDTLTPVADLSITKTNGVDDVEPGDDVTYTIVVSNAGPSSVIDAAVTDTVPAALEGVEWICAATLGSSCGDVAGTGSIASSVDLAVDGVVTFTLTAVVADDAEGSIVNTAAVSVPGGTSDPDPDDNTAVDSDGVIPVFDLAITKVADETVVETGDTLGYTIRVTNTGPSTAAGVVIEDRLPAGLAADSWTCEGTDGATCRAMSGTGAPVVSVDIPVGGAITIRLITTVTTDPGVDTDLVNIAVATVAGVGGTTITTEAAATVTIDAPTPPTPEQPQPPVEPQPPESGSNIPRTGAESTSLLGIGLATLFVGLLFLASSRIRFRRRTI